MIAAKVTVNPEFVTSNVLTSVSKALSDTFSFNSQAFGQEVAKSRIIAVMQSVPGVVSVRLEKLARNDAPAADKPEEELPSHLHLREEKAAELLTLDEVSLADAGVEP